MIFQVITGASIANRKDKNNKEFETKLGKYSVGIKNPTNNDLEKSGLGNNNKPTSKPNMIAIYAFFSKKDLL